MATQTQPRTARRYHVASAAAAQAAAQAALRARPRGIQAIWNVLALFQVAQAQVAEQSVAAMLAEQDVDAAAEALLNSAAFTTEVDRLERMLEDVEMDWQFARLVESLAQDAGRAASGVAIAARPDIGYVRMLTPPSCGRCAVLAGRVYRYSTGFLRHAGCDCVHLATTVANRAFVQDPVELMKQGLVTGLSKADQQAITAGADFGQVVNVRLRKAGLSESGRVLARRGRATPEAIYRANPTREEALAALQGAGYLR